MIWGECLDWEAAAVNCGLSATDYGSNLQECQVTMDNAAVELGDCLTATLAYWDCRTALNCGQFLVDGPGACLDSAGAANDCTNWPG